MNSSGRMLASIWRARKPAVLSRKPPNKALQGTFSPLRALAAPEFGRYCDTRSRVLLLDAAWKR
jgi:hypothetical protein